MSGGSSSDYDWPGTPDDNCDIVLRTPLNSTDERVLEKLKVGDILEIRLVIESGRKVVAAVRAELGVAGVVTSIQAAILFKCLEKGVTYIAEITKLDSPSCQVEVRRN